MNQILDIEDKILIVDDDNSFREELAAQLGEMHPVSQASNVAEFRKLYLPFTYTLVLLEMCLEGDCDGMTLLNEMMKVNPYQLVIVLTKQVDANAYIAAINNGAQLYLNKNDFQIPDLVQMAEVILKQGALQRRVENYVPLPELVKPKDMVIASPQMEKIYADIVKVAQDGEVTVMVRGETGTGKELVARNIHNLNPKRKEKPFVAVSIAGLNHSTIQSELFGHVKGAFTGAISNYEGHIKAAQGGTLFLDEIGELDLGTQAKLLRVLQERKIQHMGSTEETAVDFQLITATNRNLEEMVKRGEFRADLYYRICAWTIFVPLLKEHRQDIVPLAEFFLGRMIEDKRTTVNGFHSRTMILLQHYDWPGNVRELQNVVEHAAIQARSGSSALIQPTHLPPPFNDTSKTPYSNNYLQWLAHAEIELCELRACAIKASEKVSKIVLAQRLGYHDRFVFQRRIRKALALYPEAKNEFPTVAELFK